jgi:DNA ligase-associated metallophosphoesterase
MRTEIQGHTFTLLPERAVYWAEARALICSDLHWGRETFLQRFGMPVPERSLGRETAVLERLMQETGAEEWWILGDFIHHPQGLENTLIDRIHEWMEGRLNAGLKRIRLVPGNHDRKVRDWVGLFPMQLEADGILREGFRFLHEPEDKAPPLASAPYTWYGHLHPAMRLPLLGSKKVPCFWIRPREAYLPAFSRMAAGMEIEPSVRGDRVFVIADEQVLELPHGPEYRLWGG